MRLPLIFLLLPLVFAGGPLTLEENEEVQKICGTKFAPAPTPNSRRFRSMNTPNATREEGPWTVAIRQAIKVVDGEEITDAWCTGSLISSRHVVTAAHCLGYRSYTPPPCESNVNLNPLRIMTTTHCNTIDGIQTCDSTLKQSSIRVKKGFTSRYHCARLPKQGDVAVIELAEDVPFDNKIWPVCIGLDVPVAGTNLTLFGYGRNHDIRRTGSGVLRRLETNIVDHDTCLEYARKEEIDLPQVDTICSRHPTGFACGGDSGSGETVIQEGKASVVGVLSYGIKCDPTLPPERIMDYSSGLLMHSRWIAAVTGVNPGYAVSQVEKDLLKEEYLEYNVQPDEE